jgi:hypothetical protein
MIEKFANRETSPSGAQTTLTSLVPSIESDSLFRYYPPGSLDSARAYKKLMQNLNHNSLNTRVMLSGVSGLIKSGWAF